MRAPATRSATTLLALAIGLGGCRQSPTSPSVANTSLAAAPGEVPTGQLLAILSYESDPGDDLGQGQSAAFQLGAGQFQVALNPSQSRIEIGVPPVGGKWWDLRLEAPSGALAPGYYNYAGSFPFQPAGVPGLDFTIDGRSCGGDTTGRFLIAEARFSGTQVLRFHARFEEHCSGWSAALRGQIWIDADGAQPPPLPDFPPPLPAPPTMFSYISRPGDYIGIGRSETLTLSGMKFIARKSANRPGIDVGLRSTNGSPLVFWGASFAAASGTLLQPGSYPGATRFPFNSGVPGLDVGGNGRGCNTLRGSFIVREVSYGPSGEVLRFHATFEQHCEGGVSALLGEVQISTGPWR